MVMVEDGKGKKYSMDGFLHSSFANAKVVMANKDLDLPILISGYPGTGKSTLAMQLATFCDKTFNIDRMCVETEEFIHAVKQAEHRQAVVLDESYEGLNSREIRNDIGRALLNLLNVVRQKNLYIFLIIPNFFDMGKQIAIFRTRWLIHCYEKGFGEIGQFIAFDREGKQQLYIRGKQYNSYDAHKADFFGSFGKKIPSQIDWEAYKKKKIEAMNRIFVRKQGQKATKIRESRDGAIYYFKNELQLPIVKLAEIFNVNKDTVYTAIKRCEEKKEPPTPYP